MIFHSYDGENITEQYTCDCCNDYLILNSTPLDSKIDYLRLYGWTSAQVINLGYEQKIDLCSICSIKAMDGREIIIGNRGERYKIMEVIPY